MMLCYHPKCLNSKHPYVRLKYACDVTQYVTHLASHTDKLGNSMYQRFNAMSKDMFMNNYDEIAVSPFHLLQPGPLITNETKNFLRSYAITRDLNMMYIYHWKNIMVEEEYLSTQSLAFQEDDALVTMFLNFPRPVEDWNFWRTITTFSMKIYTSVSAAALSLYRGVTNYPSMPKTQNKHLLIDRQQFLLDVNHPAPSVSGLQEHFPTVSYENRQYHKKFQRLHLKILSNYKRSLSLDFANVTRFPVVIGIDEQELNQGTFVVDNVLHGLSHKLDVGKLREIGLNELPKFIQDSSPFISSVREYRLTDFMAAHCSNVFTEYISGVLVKEDCEASLKEIISLSNCCENCLLMNVPCNLETIDKPCQSCLETNTHCKSMVVFHVLWDMGSSHKATADGTNCITEMSDGEDMNNPELFGIGFGGLHLLKSPTNFLRNNVLTLNGQNYGVHIIRALRNTPGPHSPVLGNLKAAVAVGKDRQSDFLSFETTAKTVQESLKLAKDYKCTRVPEPMLSYTDNAKKQYKIVLPTGVQCNKNGDVFILDSGASCIHAVDRSSVAKVYLLGTHCKPSKKVYEQEIMIKASDVKLSNFLTDICIPKERDDIYVVDAGRSEVIIVRNCSTASRITSTYANIWRKKGVQSLCLFNGDVLCVAQQNLENCVGIIDLELPPVGKNASFEVTGKKKRTVKMSEQIKYVFPVTTSVIGLVTDERELIFYSKPGNKSTQKNTGIKTIFKPQIMNDSVVYLPVNSEQLNHLNVSMDKKSNEISFTYSTVKTGIPLSTHCLAVWGSTYHIVSNIHGVCKLIEYGNLSYGLKLSEDINTFYTAISYTPPYGYTSGQRKTLKECIELAKPLLDTLSSMQGECEERFPTRKSFMGIHGTVFTQTLKCFKTTVASWQALVKRLDNFDESLADRVNPHTVANESPVEHAFGFTLSQGQSQLQTQQEYLHNKMKHEVDFQLKLCDVNFCQKVKVKVRDKSYQDLDDHVKSLLTVEDLWEILLCGKTKSNHVAIDPADEKLLKQAFLLTKSVPRRSNRAKWKHESGHAPSMLIDDKNDNDGKLLKGDLVFCKNQFIKKLIVVQEVIMNDIDDTVKVEDVETSRKEVIPVSSLLIEKGMIFVIPSSLYTVVDHSIEMDEIACQMFQECLDISTTSLYTDEEIALLPSSNIPACPSNSDQNAYEGPTKAKRRKIRSISSSSDDDDDVGDDNDDDDDGKGVVDVGKGGDYDDDGDEESFSVGQWVIGAFVFELPSRTNYYLGQITALTADATKRQFQFYRCQIPGLHPVYAQLPKTEVQDVDVIVEKVPKSSIDIMCGTKVKIMGPGLNYKCV